VFTDTHCHLETFARRGDVPAVLDRAAAAGITRIITIGTCPSDWHLYATLAAAHPARIAYTVGLHPCDVGDHDQAWQAAVSHLPAFFETPESDVIPAALATPQLEITTSASSPSVPSVPSLPSIPTSLPPRPVALGEIGLDRFHLPKDPALAAANFARQEAAFRAQLALARDLACPIVIHSRQAFPDCLRVLDDTATDWSRVVFHCFTDGPDELRSLHDRGARASFTGIITYKNADAIRAALLAQGIDRLMLETDAPYLAPNPLRGQPNEPAHLLHTAREAAKILSLSLPDLAARTTANAQAFFGLEA
jgi:TatD DNase family protein